MIEQCSDVNPFEDETALDALRGLPSYEEALSRLLYLVEHGRPYGVVRGPAGTGKTPLLQCLMGELRRVGQECGFLDLRRASAEDFAWRIACELGTAPPGGDVHRQWWLVEDALQGRALAGRATILVLDHLGEQDRSLHQQLERLFAFADSCAGWCTVLGAARSEQSSRDASVQHRFDLRIELGPLSMEETHQYFRQLAEISGCATFDDESVQMLHELSGGTLRALTALGRLAILARSSEAAPQVTAEIISLVASEISPPHVRHMPAPRTAVVATMN